MFENCDKGVWDSMMRWNWVKVSPNQRCTWRYFASPMYADVIGVQSGCMTWFLVLCGNQCRSIGVAEAAFHCCILEHWPWNSANAVFLFRCFEPCDRGQLVHLYFGSDRVPLGDLHLDRDPIAHHFHFPWFARAISFRGAKGKIRTKPILETRVTFL